MLLRYLFVPLFVPLFALALSLLTACNPTFNWREVNLLDDRAKILMPGKPDALSRDIVLETIPVKMFMQGVKIDESTFTVAGAALADQTPGSATRAIAGMRAQMIRNIAGTEQSVKAIVVRVINDSGKEIATLDTQRIVVTGLAQAKPVQMTASFVQYKGYVWQWMVIKSNTAKDGKLGDAAEEFMASFRLIDNK